MVLKTKSCNLLTVPNKSSPRVAMVNAFICMCSYTEDETLGSR